VKLTDKEILVIREKFKKLANSSTKRTAEGMTLANSPLHMRAFVAVVKAQELATTWEGPREELDVKLKEIEDSIVSSLEAGDALLSDFPPGTGNAFGHTSGTPLVENDACVCHKCGEPVHLSEMEGPPAGPGAHVFLKLETGRDVLLFVMHSKCFEGLRPPSAALNASRRVNAGLDFVRIDREEWMLLLMAKDVLSS
jgi:hypothetical protein